MLRFTLEVIAATEVIPSLLLFFLFFTLTKQHSNDCPESEIIMSGFIFRQSQVQHLQAEMNTTQSPFSSVTLPLMPVADTNPILHSLSTFSPI